MTNTYNNYFVKTIMVQYLSRVTDMQQTLSSKAQWLKLLFLRNSKCHVSYWYSTELPILLILKCKVLHILMTQTYLPYYSQSTLCCSIIEVCYPITSLMVQYKIAYLTTDKVRSATYPDGMGLPTLLLIKCFVLYSHKGTLPYNLYLGMGTITLRCINLCSL